jgi:hypothetical protein
MKKKQCGAGKCTLCGSSGTSKTTCPMNPDAKNPNPKKHQLANKSKSKSKVLPKDSKLLQLKGPGSMPKPTKKSTMLTKKIKPSLSKKTFLEGLSIMDNRNRERNPIEHSRRNLGLDTMDSLFDLPKDVGNTISKYRNSFQYFEAIKTDNIDKFNELIQQRVDANIVNENGDTPLIFLLKDRYVNEMGYMFYPLLEISIKTIDTKNNIGDTALILACYNCNEDYIKAILDLGANPDISNNNGYKALNIISDECDDYSNLIHNALYYKRLKARKQLALGSALSDRLGEYSVFGNLDAETFRKISSLYQ